MAHEDHGDQMGADHLMKRGEGTCDHHLPLPRGRFNAGLLRDASFWCKTCVRGAACHDAEHGGPVTDFSELASPDDFYDDEDDDEARAHLPKPRGWDGD